MYLRPGTSKKLLCAGKHDIVFYITVLQICENALVKLLNSLLLLDVVKETKESTPNRD